MIFLKYFLNCIILMYEPQIGSTPPICFSRLKKLSFECKKVLSAFLSFWRRDHFVFKFPFPFLFVFVFNCLIIFIKNVITLILKLHYILKCAFPYVFSITFGSRNFVQNVDYDLLNSHDAMISKVKPNHYIILLNCCQGALQHTRVNLSWSKSIVASLKWYLYAFQWCGLCEDYFLCKYKEI